MQVLNNVDVTIIEQEPKHQTIGEIVAKDYRKAEVFKKYHIDFCCGGKKSVAEACAEKNVNLADVECDLELLDAAVSNPPRDFDKWELDLMIDYIVETHHKYLEKNIPILIDYTAKVSQVHGQKHPEVVEIAEKFHEAAFELIHHMKKEEEILFPYIKQLVNQKETKSDPAKMSFGSVRNPINMMEHEHELVGDLFKSIRSLSNDYTPPEGACTTYKVSFLKLNEFENDLHQHIHLENNILFPKSILLENKN